MRIPAFVVPVVMSARRARYPAFVLVVAIAVATGGCVTQRTVTEGGQVVRQKYVVTNPIWGGNR